MNKVKLSSIIDIISGGTPKTDIIEYWENGTIGWLSVTDFNNDLRYVYNSEKRITNEGLKNSNTKLLEKGDIIISARGTVGALAQIGKPMCFNQSCFGLRGKKGIVDTDFLYYALKNYVHNIKKRSQGSVFDTINLNSFDLMEIEIPKELKDQQKIASVLSALDSKIELNNRINAELEAMAKTLYDYWFVQFDFPDENGKPYKTSGGKMVWNEELKREIPEGWEVKKFGDVVAIKNGRDHKHLNNGSYPIYGSGGIMRHSDSFLYDSESILIPRKGSLGNLFYINEPFWCVDTIFYTQMKFPQSCKYLFYTTQNFNIAKMNTGTAVPSMTTEILNNLTLVFPPTNTLKSFDDFLIPIFKKKNKINIENQKLAELRDWLLPMLMNGQVKFTE